MYNTWCSGVAPGGWSSIGLSVQSVDDQRITCNSNHLTSFAVLVDVSGSSQVINGVYLMYHMNYLLYTGYIGWTKSCIISRYICWCFYLLSLLVFGHNLVHSVQVCMHYTVHWYLLMWTMENTFIMHTSHTSKVSLWYMN